MTASVGELVGPIVRKPLASPMGSSLILAAVGASLTVALAWSLAWRARRPGPWRWVAAATVAATLATPGPVAGMALVLAYVGWPAVYDSPALVVLAYGFRTLPYALLVLWPAVRGLAPEYLEAAGLDGYGPLGQVVRVALPLTRGAIVAAWGVAFDTRLQAICTPQYYKMALFWLLRHHRGRLCPCCQLVVPFSRN